MASLVSRLVACLVAVVAVLQLVHLVLLNKLESRRLSELHNLQAHTAGGGGFSAPVGEDHPRPGSINNGPQRLSQLGPNDMAENEQQLAARLLREDEGTIVDSTGEFRIVFDIAGPRPNNGDAGLSPRIPNRLQQLAFEQPNDDFSIDDEALDGIDVTLVTQSDLTNARGFLVKLVERWDGPISLALFARNTSQVEASLEFIAQARHCHELMRQYVSFHLVFPLVEMETRINPNKTKLVGRRRKRKPLSQKSLSFSQECQTFNEDVARGRKLVESNVNYDDRKYPINLLRNVARKRVMTEFSFLTDIDMIPSNGLRSKFQKFARDKQLDKAEGDDKKSVFVVPAFESKNGEAPGTKRELLALVDRYQVRPFYFDLCWKCQVHTDYETWQREPESRTGDLTVLFEVLWKDPWEPFFISDNSVANFDERFRQYGFNRISQLCELHVAGFKFAVLNDAFLIHQGYKTTQSFHPGRSRDIENNRLNFRQFKIELKDRYPHSTRRCY